MKNRSRKPHAISHTYTHCDIPYFRNHDIDQHPFEIFLCKGLDSSDKDSGNREPADYRHCRHHLYGKLRAEYRKHESDHHIRGHLGHQGGDQCAYGRRSRAVSIRQPYMEREESHLDAYGDH